MTEFAVHILENKFMNFANFYNHSSPNSIGIDIAKDSANENKYSLESNRFIFQFNNDAMRVNKSMSVCKQVFFAIKGKIIERMEKRGRINIYTCHPAPVDALAIWMLRNHGYFESTKDNEQLYHLVDTFDRLFLSGGTFPFDRDDSILPKIKWILAGYPHIVKMRKMTISELDQNLKNFFGKLDAFYKGSAEEIELDTRHEVLHEEGNFKIIKEIGKDALGHLFSEGLKSFIALRSQKDNNRFSYLVSSNSIYSGFPIKDLIEDFNRVEKDWVPKIWEGNEVQAYTSFQGSGITWINLRDLVRERLKCSKF